MVKPLVSLYFSRCLCNNSLWKNDNNCLTPSNYLWFDYVRYQAVHVDRSVIFGIFPTWIFTVVFCFLFCCCFTHEFTIWLMNVVIFFVSILKFCSIRIQNDNENSSTSSGGGSAKTKTICVSLFCCLWQMFNQFSLTKNLKWFFFYHA